jgi:hypothetical protein
MPIKCSFCRRKYASSGPYEKHLRIAHASLGTVLTSGLVHQLPLRIESEQDDDGGLLGQNDLIDSDYESDAGPSGYAPNPAHVPDAEALNTDYRSPDAIETAYYPLAGRSIGDVIGFEEEHSILIKDPWAPFTSAHGFKLASWFIQSKVSKSRINEYFSSGLGDSASAGYSSMYTLENHLRLLDPHGQYLRWFEGQVDDGKRTLPFYYRNILDCVRYLLRQAAYRDDLVFAPRREYDHNGQRVYAEMHTADWWWDVQVNYPLLISHANAS